MYWLFSFFPAAFLLNHFGADPLVVFFACMLAIIPMAQLMEVSTTALARLIGPVLGGLLSATMSNAPELIIGISALRNGLTDILKYSIVGAIIGTLLFGLGLTIFCGNFRRRPMPFDAPMVAMNMGLLTVTSLGLTIPAIFNLSVQADHAISFHICVLMLLLYLGSVYYTLNQDNPPIDKTGVATALGQSKPAAPIERLDDGREIPDHASWGFKKAMSILIGITIALALTSDLLTDSIQPTAETLHLTPFFAGMFLLSMVGNIPQFINSVSFARQNQMTLALSVNLSSVTQLSLLVAPLLVLSGPLFGQSMDLVFSNYSLFAIMVSVVVARYLLADNRTTWLEGFMLIIMYLMMAVGFFYLPAFPT